jgi:hypothetical protein
MTNQYAAETARSLGLDFGESQLRGDDCDLEGVGDQ